MQGRTLDYAYINATVKWVEKLDNRRLMKGSGGRALKTNLGLRESSIS